MSAEHYDLVVAGPAARGIAETLPAAVAFAVIELVTGPLIENPRRVGSELRGQLAGIWSARRGDYRVLFEIDTDHHQVTVLRVAHRADFYGQ